jgi:hypothetical protein
MSKKVIKFVAAAVIYIVFAVYLYQPYFKRFNSLQYLIVVNVCLASLGCFVLSRRWVSSFFGSLFAGAIYGFGPFALGLAAYHPTAGTLAAAVPWLFLPAAFCAKDKRRWLSIPLSTLPFLGILLFFRVSAYFRLFAVPMQVKLHLADLAGIIAPAVSAERNLTLLGFYHVPIASLIIGFAMLFKARRFGIMIIFAAGTIPAFCNPVFGVSPIIWLTIPVLCCSVLVGMGMQALAWAGEADRRWPLAAAVVTGILSIVTLLLATEYFQAFAGLADSHAKLLTETAKMYILGTIALAIIFFISRAKLRLHPFRWAVLFSATAVDIFCTAPLIVDIVL